MKILGKDNDLRTEDGTITKKGYVALALSSVFGFGLFLIGRYIYGKRRVK
jgi:hypothetical protein